MILGGIEAGGTKMVFGIADEEGRLVERKSIPTTTPEENFREIADYFKEKNIEALGIGAFGPIDPNPESPKFGWITNTPKKGWSNVDFGGWFKRELGVPVGFDTDTNAAILGEARFGSAKGTQSAIYITVGTGIGIGVYINGGLLHGMLHPEAGHLFIGLHQDDVKRGFKGICPVHGRCLEGMACGPAIETRWGKSCRDLANNDMVWEIETYYLAQAISNYILAYSPEKIILWGGVMHTPGLLKKVRIRVKELLNGYIDTKEMEHIENYIVTPQLEDNPGIIGATQLGLDAYKESQMDSLTKVYD